MEQLELPVIEVNREMVQKENPLLNAVVLSTVFKYSSFKDLTNIRPVCKQWYDVSLEHWRSKAVLNLKRKKGEMRVLPAYFECFMIGRRIPLRVTQNVMYRQDDEVKFENKKYVGLDELLHLFPESDQEDNMFKLRTRPYRQYHVTGGISSTEGFWNVFGSWIHELYINSSELISMSCWKKIIFEETPNLKKLVMTGDIPKRNNQRGADGLSTTIPSNQCGILKVLDIRDQRWLQQLPVEWVDFLEYFSKLEEVILPLRGSDVVQIAHSMYRTSFNTFLKAVIHLKSGNPDTLPITHLDSISAQEGIQGLSIDYFPVSTVDLLERAKLNLKTLKVDIGFKTADSVIERLFNLFVDTVESLVVFKGHYSNPSGVPYFPFTQPMNNLHTLEIVGPIVFNMSFLRFTPNLEKLVLTDVYHSRYPYKVLEEEDKASELLKRYYGNTKKIVDEAAVLTGDFKLLNLNEFQGYFKLENVSSVKMLGRWMPNLEKLRVGISASAFPKVCHQWRELKELMLNADSSVDDEAITGFNKKTVYHNNRPPNISSLKNLKVFKMENVLCSSRCTHGPLPRVTNHAFHHGFLHLPELKDLQVQMTQEISKSCLESLKEKRVNITTTVKFGCSLYNTEESDIEDDIDTVIDDDSDVEQGGVNVEAKSDQGKDGGESDQGNDEGISDQGKDGGESDQGNDEGISDQGNDEGISDQRKDGGESDQGKDEGKSDQGKDGGESDQIEDEGESDQIEDEGKSDQKKGGEII